MTWSYPTYTRVELKTGRVALSALPSRILDKERGTALLTCPHRKLSQAAAPPLHSAQGGLPVCPVSLRGGHRRRIARRASTAHSFALPSWQRRQL